MHPLDPLHSKSMCTPDVISPKLYGCIYHSYENFIRLNFCQRPKQSSRIGYFTLCLSLKETDMWLNYLIRSLLSPPQKPAACKMH